MNAKIFVEALDLSESEFDSANRVLRNVGLIKVGKSLNKRMYSEAVLRDAVGVFEGTKAFDSHATGEKRERRVGELTGWYENVRFENGAIRADRHFLTTRAGQDVMAVVEAIKNGAPRTLAGLSINAVGTGKTENIDGENILLVQSITAANSCDDVLNPAASGSYFEATQDADGFATQLIASMDYEEWLLARPEFVDKLKREWKQVRLEEATKTALAESDVKVKTAETATREAQEALQETQTAHTALTTANDKLTLANAALRVEIAVIEALDGIQLPAAYVKDLRKELPKLAPSEWVGKIETELSKAKRTSSEKVIVSGAGMQESKALNLTTTQRVTVDDYLPRDNEDIGAWQERVARLNQNSMR